MAITSGIRRGRGAAASDGSGRRAGGGLSSLSTKQTLGMAALLVFLVLTLALPLRTFAEQRAELAETRENIARMEQRTVELQEQKERFADPEYVKEQARIRLGLVEEGETPFRIIDPALGTGDGGDPVGEEVKPSAPWYEQLWDSVATPPKEEKPANPARDEATSPDRLPTVPEPEPAPEEAGPENQPPVG
ncbi:septum formation initiator family protein [uncultured Corynebacterium sp.]|uniref:FtsB family cell division protein n=1 Tax=uncultured Corynebacterium sp. TaxID=159447 RepID=UPI0025EF482B|nr:septum formation initiator family protein [uncultured Corynebacterium sp.]